MFKTYDVADSFGQMNLFMALQVYRNLSTLTYFSAVQPVETTPEQCQDQVKTERKERPQ
jgi:hypothetical protein